MLVLYKVYFIALNGIYTFSVYLEFGFFKFQIEMYEVKIKYLYKHDN